MNSSYDDNMRGSCSSNTWQNQCGQSCCSNMMLGVPNNGCNCQPAPIVMPTRVMARQAFSFVEQPIIVPVECRTINRTVLVPRFYPAFTQTFVNCQN